MAAAMRWQLRYARQPDGSIGVLKIPDENWRGVGLDDIGAARLAYLTGPRFDAARGLLTLTAERFPSRTENRRYLIHQLELLKRAASEADDEFDAAWRRRQEE